MKASLVIYNIKTLYTPFHEPPLRKEKLNELKVINNAYIAVNEGKIIAFSDDDYRSFVDSNTKLIDAEGKIALPGFVDAHTHLVHAGSRENEFALLKAGVPYLDILAQGGGILNTVKATREASFEELYSKARKSLETMITYGVTTLEVKSGYGLNLETELKQLKVAHQLSKELPALLSLTYMEAHAVPPRYKDKKEEYVETIIRNLDEIKKLGYVTAVDVFCEEGVFSLKETEKILLKAKSLGFDIRLHADELKPMGGLGLAVKLDAKSADHLVAASAEDIKALGKSNTYATLLPGTSFYLKNRYAKARLMINNNAAISIAGDYNPGSNPSENFLFVMQLAANYFDLTSAEVLSAVTLNPADLLGVASFKGSIAVNKDADILLLDAPNLDYVMSHYGINLITDVFIQGKRIINNRKWVD